MIRILYLAHLLFTMLDGDRQRSGCVGRVVSYHWTANFSVVIIIIPIYVPLRGSMGIIQESRKKI